MGAAHFRGRILLDGFVKTGNGLSENSGFICSGTSSLYSFFFLFKT
jgi:hypothetical protein